MDPWGHDSLSEEGVKAAMRELPHSMNWVRYFLSETSTAVVYRDMTDVFTLGQWLPFGQPHHFMRSSKDATAQCAYQAGVSWIHQNASTAAMNLRRVWKERLVHYNPMFVSEPMGNGVHALQDSFSPAHTLRQQAQDILVIADIHIYDAANKKPHGDWPGHKQLDEQWRGPFGKEAMLATRELLRVVIYSSLQKTEQLFSATWTSLWQTFGGMFLAAKDPAWMAALPAAVRFARL